MPAPEYASDNARLLCRVAHESLGCFVLSDNGGTACNPDHLWLPLTSVYEVTMEGWCREVSDQQPTVLPLAGFVRSGSLFAPCTGIHGPAVLALPARLLPDRPPVLRLRKLRTAIRARRVSPSLPLTARRRSRRCLMLLRMCLFPVLLCAGCSWWRWWSLRLCSWRDAPANAGELVASRCYLPWLDAFARIVISRSSGC